MSLPHDPAPPELVSRGRYNFGTYSSPLKRVNPLDAEGSLPRLIRNARLKEWEAFQLGNDDWFVCGAVYSAKMLGLLYLAAVHWPTGKIYRWTERVPGWRLRVARGLDGTLSAGQTNKLTVSVENRLPRDGITVRASFAGDSELPRMGLEVVGHGAVGEAGHLVICHPFSESRALYSNKAFMAAEGEMSIGDSTVRFEAGRSFMILDDHKGDYPFPMKYDWVTGARIESGGRRIGFNLTDNQVLNPELFNENAVFINDRVHRLGAVRFSRPHGVNSTWTVRDSVGAVDVRFHPDVSNEMHLGPRRVLAEYFGPYGRFDGSIRIEGELVDVSGFRGMGEQKVIRG